MNTSYFALFDLEPRFALVPAQLDAAYRTLVARVHPDRHIQAGEAGQTQALMLASTANEAYRTLKKPVARARHLLALRGIDAGEQSTDMAQTFLLEQMEWREALQDARAARDDRTLRELATAVQARATRLLNMLELQLDTAPDAAAAAASVNQLLFVEKLADAINEARALLEE